MQRLTTRDAFCLGAGDHETPGTAPPPFEENCQCMWLALLPSRDESAIVSTHGLASAEYVRDSVIVPYRSLILAHAVSVRMVTTKKAR